MKKAGFLIFSQSRDGPERKGAVSRFDTMPSRPMRHACRKIVAPSSSVWSLSTMPSRRPRSSLASRFLRSLRGRPRRSSRQLQQVEGVQHGLGDRAAAVQSVKDRHAIRAAHHCLAVERKRPGAQQGRGDGDRWVAGAPVVAPSGEQAHLVADAADLQAISVVLDLVHPARSRGHSVGAGGDAGWDEAGAG